MDVKKLIKLVHGHKCLWDQSNPNYHVREQQNNSWREISKEMKTPVDDLKKKWRGLRDTFGRELKKRNKIKSELRWRTGGEHDREWPYFKLLLFLQGTISQRDVKKEEISFYKVVISDNVGSERQITNLPLPGLKKISTSIPPLKKIKPNQNDTGAKLLENKEEELKYSNNENDSDTQFLLSLRPYLRAIPKSRKLMVRTKLQQVLIDEQNIPSAVQKYEYSSDSS